MVGVAEWPQSLRTAISIMLESRFAMVVAWGPEFRFFYNDRYRPILGTKHPAALGDAGRARSFPKSGRSSAPSSSASAGAKRSRSTTGCSRSIATATWRTAGSRCPTARSGTKRGGVGGVLAVVAETTGRVEGERRLATLRELARRASDATTPEQACVNAGAGVRRQSHRRAVRADLPARSRRHDRRGACARRHRAGSSGDVETVRPGLRLGRRLALAEVVATGRTVVRSDLRQRIGPLPGRAVRRTHAHGGSAAAVAARSRSSLRRAGRRRQSSPGARRSLPRLLRAGRRPHRHGDQQCRRARGGAAPRRGAGRDRSREDGVLQQRQPRVQNAADPDARPGRGPSRRRARSSSASASARRSTSCTATPDGC